METERSQKNKGKTKAHGKGPQPEDVPQSLLWPKILIYMQKG